MDQMFDSPPSTHKRKLPKDPVEEMVGALTDPIIVFPGGGWEDTIPRDLKDEVPIMRLAHVHQALQGESRWDEATDLEALLYLYPASLTAPLDRSWTNIYVYLTNQVKGGDNMPPDLRVDTLRDDEQRELEGLKRWIYQKRVEARHNRRKQQNKEQKQEQAVEVEYEQLSFGW